jgi:predicted RNase H-like HicB family nuclease
MDRYIVNIEPAEASGVVLTVAGLPRVLIFAETPAEALWRAREAIAFHRPAESRTMDRGQVELVLRDPLDGLWSGEPCPAEHPTQAPIATAS